MKTTQKILALLLCGVMLFLFAGCSPAALFGKTNQYDMVEYNAWTDEDGTETKIPPIDKVYYLAEEYVDDKHQLNPFFSHPALIPEGASKEEEQSIITEIENKSVLVWERSK